MLRILMINTILLSISMELLFIQHIFDSNVKSIPTYHAGERGSIPRRGDFFFP